MEAKNIIFGTLALAVVGGGAYFYFKNKKKVPFSDQLSSALSSSTSTTGTSTSGDSKNHSPAGAKDTSDKVLDNAPVTNAQAQANQQENTKQLQAQALATQIWTLKSPFASLQSAIPTCTSPILNMGSWSEYEKCNTNYTQIISIKNKMKELGYKEDNGLAVKI